MAKNYKVTTIKEKLNKFQEYSDLAKGITQGSIDLTKENRFSNKDLGQRSPEAQEAMKLYSFYKMEGAKALEAGEITGEQFNYLKGKAGSGTHLSHYIDDERFPGLNQTAFNIANFIYQAKQSITDGQSIKKMVTDLYDQGRGANDKSPLLSAELELNLLKEQNKK
tara:strand:- start:155 stop:652 length:498 start_codon:yes stop_codon:yes gene_type:complete